MTKVSYDICLNNRKVKNVTGYEEAQKIVAELGRGWTFKAVYTPIFPDDTAKKLGTMKERVAKIKNTRTA